MCECGWELEFRGGVNRSVHMCNCVWMCVQMHLCVSSNVCEYVGSYYVNLCAVAWTSQGHIAQSHMTT